MAPEIKVLIVDEPGKRGELRKSLGSDLNVVGEAGFGTEAFTAARESRPNVVVVSLEEPIVRPLRTIELLTVGEDAPAVVVVSSSGDRENIRKAMLAGARDYLVKPIRGLELHQAVVAVWETEQRRRELVAGPTGPQRAGEVIAVFGAKGGIGKTTLAVNLAVAIAQQTKQRVALLDLDTQLGDVAVMLDFVPERTIVDAAEMVDRLEPELVQTLLHEDRTGIRVLAGPLRPDEGEAIGAHHISKIVEVMANTYDYVVIDTAPHFTDTLVSALDAATMILLLTTPDVPSLKNTKLTIGVMRNWGYSEDKVKMVVNYAYTSDGVLPSDAENTLEYPIFWKIPNDSAATTAIKVGRPVIEVKPGSKLAQNIQGLAQSICGIKTKGGGFPLGLFRR